MVVSAKAKSAILTVGHGREGMVKISDDGVLAATLGQPTHQQVRLGLDDGLQLVDVLSREELGNGGPPHAVKIVGDGGQGRVADAAGADRVPAPFVALPMDAPRDVERVVELRLADVKLARVDAHNGAVSRVHVPDNPYVAAAPDNIVVELVPGGNV